MFECRTVQNQIWELEGGSLSEARVNEIRSHIASCEACREHAAAVHTMRSGLHGMRTQALPASMLGWRDLANRVENVSMRRQRVSFRAIGGGTLALAACASAVFMFINTRTDLTLGSAAPGAHLGKLKLPAAGDPFKVAGGDVALAVPEDERSLSQSGISDLQTGANFTGPGLRSAPPRPSLSGTRRANIRLASNRSQATGTPVPTEDSEYPDGGAPRQALHSDYVLQSASSGNDEEQNRRYVIDVVSSRTTGATEGTEDLHPW